jgi:hypothetical protein
MTLFREPWPDDKEVNGGNAYHCAQTPPPLKAEESCARILPPQSRQVPPPPPLRGEAHCMILTQRHEQVTKEVNTTYRAQLPPPVGGGDTRKATFTQNEASAPASRKPQYTQHSRAPRLSQRPLMRRKHSKNATSPQQQDCS